MITFGVFRQDVSMNFGHEYQNSINFFEKFLPSVNYLYQAQTVFETTTFSSDELISKNLWLAAAF